jgi:hypothetical protein
MYVMYAAAKSSYTSRFVYGSAADGKKQLIILIHLYMYFLVEVYLFQHITVFLHVHVNVCIVCIYGSWPGLSLTRELGSQTHRVCHWTHAYIIKGFGRQYCLFRSFQIYLFIINIDRFKYSTSILLFFTCT